MYSLSNNVLSLFQWAVASVPAYAQFLSENGIDYRQIKTLADFSSIPLVDKENYLRKYAYADLFPQKKIPSMVSASSGSSGTPFFWPRGVQQEDEGGHIHERIFKDIFNVQEKTLVVICFSMGNWVAGTFTASCARWVAERGYDISVITPGIDKSDVLAVLADFAPHFKRVVLAGYPPFLMDIVNGAQIKGIDLASLNIRLLCAGENFSEEWRDTIHSMCGIDDCLSGSASVYGTADAAILGHESPLCIFLRRKAIGDARFSYRLFGDVSFIPTVVHYYPQYKHFEVVNGGLVFSAKSGLPLVRYNIKDKGTIFSFEQIVSLLGEYGYLEEAREKGVLNWKLPLIILRGRDDGSITFYALNIYPENIKAGLQDHDISKYVSGKFIASTKMKNRHREQVLIIHVELSYGVHSSDEIKEKIRKKVVDKLMELNAEYRKLYNAIEEKALPEILLEEFSSRLFEVRKSKHKWVQ